MLLHLSLVRPVAVQNRQQLQREVTVAVDIHQEGIQMKQLVRLQLMYKVHQLVRKYFKTKHSIELLLQM